MQPSQHREICFTSPPLNNECFGPGRLFVRIGVFGVVLSMLWLSLGISWGMWFYKSNELDSSLVLHFSGLVASQMIAVLELVSFADVSQYMLTHSSHSSFVNLIVHSSIAKAPCGRSGNPTCHRASQQDSGSYLCTWQNDFSDAFNFKPWIQIPKFIGGWFQGEWAGMLPMQCAARDVVCGSCSASVYPVTWTYQVASFRFNLSPATSDWTKDKCRNLLCNGFADLQSAPTFVWLGGRCGLPSSDWWQNLGERWWRNVKPTNWMDFVFSHQLWAC